MECKGRPQDPAQPGKYRFNRDIVECKGRMNGRINGHSEDLIETLWNVKL